MAEMFPIEPKSYCIEEEPVSYECSEFDFDPDEKKSQRSIPRPADRRR
jgi:hypothetical protein